MDRMHRHGLMVRGVGGAAGAPDLQVLSPANAIVLL